jgi:hypothetical protein
MDAGSFDRLAATLGTGRNRRRAIAGLAAGMAAVLGHDTSTKAKKKRCKTCRPLQSCCSCRVTKNGPATTCFLIEGLVQGDAQDKCVAACGGLDLVFEIDTPAAGALYSCSANHTCNVKTC